MTVWLDPIPYLGDDLLFLDELTSSLGSASIPAPHLFRASENEKRGRIEKYGTDRGGYEGDRMWRGSEAAGLSLRHADVILATTRAQIEEGARDPSFSTSFKKLPGIEEPLVLVYDPGALRRLGEKEWAFAHPEARGEALLAAAPVKKLALPEGWLEPAEGLHYRALVRAALSRGRGTVVEVGCWKGRSAAYVGRLVGMLGGQFFCVDHFAGSSDRYREAYLEMLADEDVRASFESNMEAMGIDVGLHAASSTDAAALFDDRSVDLVFLDASHDEAAVNDDIMAWRPKLRAGGILAGHDHNFDQPGVLAAVAGLCRELDVTVGPGSFWFAVVRP